MGVVRFGTVSANVDSTAFVTDVFVALTVTVYTPGFVALPETTSVFVSNLSPAGRPETASFGSESDATRPPSASSYEPSAAVASSDTVTLRLALSSSAVANIAVSATSSEVPT